MPQYLKEVRAEMRHVTWPSRRQAVLYTAVVVIISLATATYLGLWDYVLAALLRRII
jgi:preprotein translocase subunit SecE